MLAVPQRRPAVVVAHLAADAAHEERQAEQPQREHAARRERLEAIGEVDPFEYSEESERNWDEAEIRLPSFFIAIPAGVIGFPAAQFSITIPSSFFRIPSPPWLSRSEEVGKGFLTQILKDLLRSCSDRLIWRRLSRPFLIAIPFSLFCRSRASR